jgi:Lysylphosphatidylglycerol synthase TM region
LFAATGHPMPVDALVVGYLIGCLATMLPVPDGFGVLEAGLAGMLIAYGAPATEAAAAVVVYHTIAFWIPSLGGVIGYAFLRRRELHEVPHRDAATGEITSTVHTSSAGNAHTNLRAIDTEAANRRTRHPRDPTPARSRAPRRLNPSTLGGPRPGPSGACFRVNPRAFVRPRKASRHQDGSPAGAY